VELFQYGSNGDGSVTFWNVQCAGHNQFSGVAAPAIQLERSRAVARVFQFSE
jgi:hypothetical protein